MTKTLATGLTSACLLLLLAGCSSPQILGAPPASLLADTPEPQPAGATNKAVLEWALDLSCALKMANADKAALRAWAAKQDYAPEPVSCLRN